jgi:hypothetical protein
LWVAFRIAATVLPFAPRYESGLRIVQLATKKGLEAMDQLAKHVLRVVEDITEQTEETIRRADLETINYRALRIES